MTTMLSIIERIPDEAAAWEYMEALRWKGTPEWDMANNQPAAHDHTGGAHDFTPSAAPLEGWCEICGQVEVDHIPGATDPADDADDEERT